jgi:GH35 family endo-1,4-beta-xylanase
MKRHFSNFPKNKDFSMKNTFMKTLAFSLATLAIAVPSAHGQTFHPAVNAFFNSTDKFVQDTVIPNIDKYRKGNLSVKILDQTGNPDASAAVTISLRRHFFHFGAGLPTRDTADKTATNYYQRTKLWGDVFNFAMCPSSMKWASVEAVRGVYDWTKFERDLDTLLSYKAGIVQHFLTGYHPAWVDSLDSVSGTSAATVATLAAAQQAYATAVLTRYKNRIPYFQVYNEDWVTHQARAKVYFDQTSFFTQLVQQFPGVKLGVADCWYNDNSLPTRPFPPPDTVKARYPGIAFIASHGHQPHATWVSPQDIYNVYKNYVTSDIKVHISEFGTYLGAITSTYYTGLKQWNDTNIAKYYVQMYATCFSHPAFEAFNMIDIGPDSTTQYVGTEILNTDLTPKPAYLAIKSLLKDKLTTNTSGTTTAAGDFAFRGFYGDYDVTVQLAGGQTATRTVSLTPGSLASTSQIVVADGKPYLVESGTTPDFGQSMGATLTSIYSDALKADLALADKNGTYFYAVPTASAAALAGFHAEDVVRSINGVAVSTKDGFITAYGSIPQGSTVSALVWRLKDTLTMTFVKNDAVRAFPAQLDRFRNSYSFERGRVRINIVSPADFSMNVFSLSGRLCARYATSAATGRFSVDLKDYGLCRGLYIAHVTLAGKKSVHQICMW